MEMREAADYLGLKSQITKLSIQAFNTLPLPALIEYQGGWKVMIQTDDNGWTAYDPATDSLHTLSFTSAESTAHYKVMLIADESLSVKEVKFGLSWFALPFFAKKPTARCVSLRHRATDICAG